MGKGDTTKGQFKVAIIVSISSLITSLIVGGIAAVFSWYFTDQAVTSTGSMCQAKSNVTMIYYQENVDDDEPCYCK